MVFHAGLNVLLSDKSEQATSKQTRNSAGKTSFVEIVHFMYGADCDPSSIFRTPELIEHTFRSELTIAGEKFIIERGGADPSKIFLMEGGAERDELPKRTDRASERTYVSNEKWKTFLGHALFGLPASEEGTIYDDANTPSFRSLFAYFARRQNSGGFLDPERQAEKQQRGDWQVNLSYLLGLDWQIPYEFSKVRAREKTLEELKKAARQGAFGEILGTVAQLRPQVAVAEEKARKLREDLAHFEVLGTYKEQSRRAAQAKTEMQAISRRAVGLNERLEYLEQALAIEKPPARIDLEQLYAAAGVELPNVALRRFEEVSIFYDSVIANRREHLEQEISRIRSQLQNDERTVAMLDQQRGKIMTNLQGKGALDDFIGMQKDLAEAEATAAALGKRFQAAKIVEGENTSLAIDRANLQRRLQEDHAGRDERLQEAILIIADAISELYDDRTGGFVVEATDNGPMFRISIEGDRGDGISHAEIFCFDIALLTLNSKQGRGPGFLIHDSHLFDGVDERQVASALRLGKRVAEKLSVQYIVTMNSDIFDRLPLPDGVSLQANILSARLSDSGESGGLFGFRFG